MYDYNKISLKQCKNVAKEVKKMEKANFYPEEFGYAYNFLTLKRNNLNMQLEELEKDLDEYMQVDEYIISLDEGPIKNIVESIAYRFGSYTIPNSNIEYIKENIRTTKEELSKLNNEAWNFYLSNVLRSEQLYFQADDYYKDVFETDELRWVFNIDFETENIIKVKEKLFESIKTFASKEVLSSFIWDNRYNFEDFIEKDGKIDPNKFYPVIGSDPWYVSWDDNKTLDGNKLRSFFGTLYALLSIGLEPSSGIKLIEEKTESLFRLNDENKRLATEFMDSEIKFFKTKNTEIKFPERIAKVIEKEIKKKKRRR